MEPTDNPWLFKVTKIVGVAGVMSDVKVGTAPNVAEDLVKVPLDALPKLLVPVSNVKLPAVGAGDAATVYGPAKEPAPTKVTEVPAGTISAGVWITVAMKFGLDPVVAILVTLNRFVAVAGVGTPMILVAVTV